MTARPSFRSKDLIKHAIEAMEDGRSPFEDGFLIEHDVTLDEVYTLSDQLALGARLYLYTMEQAGKGGIHAQNAGLNLAGAMDVA